MTLLDHALTIPAAEYHAATGDPRKGLNCTSSLLRMMVDNPRLCQMFLNGEYKKTATEAMDFGTVFGCAKLEPLRFLLEYQSDADAPVNPATGKLYGRDTKKYSEWTAAQPKKIITVEEMALIEKMDAALKAHEVADHVLSNPCALAEKTFRAELYGVPCQCRPDWIADDVIYDLKTCQDLTWFEADARKYGYILQLAFYRAVISSATDRCMKTALIAVEKQVPYRVGVWNISIDVIKAAKEDIKIGLKMFKKCLDIPDGLPWPTFYESEREITYYERKLADD